MTQGLLAITTLGLTAFSFGNGPVWTAYACLTLTGIAQAFLRPARWALMPQVVPKEPLQNAITWNSTSWQVAALAGPAVGGLLIARTGGAGYAYLTNAMLTLLSTALIFSIRTRPAETLNNKVMKRARCHAQERAIFERVDLEKRTSPRLERPRRIV